MITLSSETPASDNPETNQSTDETLTLEEKLVQWALVLLLPFLITFTAFGVVILAFSQWKLY